MSELAEQRRSDRDPGTGNPMNLTCAPNTLKGTATGTEYAIVLDPFGDAPPPDNSWSLWTQFDPGSVEYAVTAKAHNGGVQNHFPVAAAGVKIYYREPVGRR